MSALLIISILINCRFYDHSTTYQMDKTFDWIVGLWQRTNEEPDQLTYEEWVKVNDEEYSGKGWMMKQKDTAFIEYLTIHKIDNLWYYTADVPENKNPVSFHIYLIEEAYFIAQNNEHDFPKKIEYRKDNSDSLLAIVSDDFKSLRFNFRKI